MKKITDFLLKPFADNLMLFLALWLLASSADGYYWCRHGYLDIALYRTMYGFIQCYLIVLLMGLLKPGAFRIVRVVFIFLGFVNMIGDTCIHAILHDDFSDLSIPLITGTNAAETSEFFPTYINARIVGFVLAVSLLVLLCVLFRRRVKAGKWLSYSMCAVLLASILTVSIKKSTDWDGTYMDKARLFIMHESIRDLSGKDLPDPQIEYTDNNTPENIVLVIGESLSKRHCSLYGYHKPTTPCMDSLYKAGELIRFDNVEAAYVSTVEAFKSMMTTFHHDYSGKWYDYPNLLAVMHKAGYSTRWVSNQSNANMGENVVAAIGNLADSTIWAGSSKGLSLETSYDGCVLPHISRILSDSRDSSLFLVTHLMGQHENFVNRFPPESARFVQDDYSDHPLKHRKNLCNYDNAVAYGDSVVLAIFREFQDKDALVLFFPDHSIDIYDSDPTYCGHARDTDPVSRAAGREIPFVAYPSPLFRELHPEKVAALKAGVNKKFNMADLIYTVMDIAGVRFENEGADAGNSLLRP